MAASLGAESERWCMVLVIVERDGSLVLVVEPTRLAVPCPQCGELSRRQHSHYDRHPLDLPWRGKTVRMRVHSRRWFCDTPTCPRKVFAERFDGLGPLVLALARSGLEGGPCSWLHAAAVLESTADQASSTESSRVMLSPDSPPVK